MQFKIVKVRNKIMKFSPEMRIVKFGSDDVIATSGATRSIALTNFGGTPRDGIITYNGAYYSSSSDFLNAYGASRNAGINNGTSEISVNNLFEREYSDAGVSSLRWNGTYTYDANATWNNGTKDIKGVFTKQ